MVNKSLRAMVRGRWHEFKREPSAMFFVFIMPIVWMLVLGLAFSGGGEHTYSIGMFKPAELNESEKYQETAATVGQILEDETEDALLVGDAEAIKTWLQRGKIVMAVEIAPDGSLVYHYDPTNSDARQARNTVNDLLQTNLGRKDAINATDQLLTIPGQRYIDFLVPGLLGFSLLSTSIYGTGMTIVSHRKENLLKRFRATPMNPYLYFLSYIIGRFWVMSLEVLIISCAGKLMFDVGILGSLPAYLLVCLAATAAFTSISILMGSRLQNTSGYNGFANLLILPSMLLGGVWFSHANFPSWLSNFSQFLPLTLCVDALRKIALEGLGLAAVYWEIALLLAYTVVSSIVAKRIFKWY